MKTLIEILSVLATIALIALILLLLNDVHFSSKRGFYDAAIFNTLWVMICGKVIVWINSRPTAAHLPLLLKEPKNVGS